MKWLQEVILESEEVKLLPLRASHKEDLLKASSDGNLWELWFTSVPSIETIDSYMAKAFADAETDTGLAFVVIDKKSNTIIGSTRYCNAAPEHRRVEIGYTWYAKRYQKTCMNSACKLLLLTHAFESLGAIAVEFRTNWYNFPSRNAIQRLGAKQDGVLRNHQVMADGTFRDTVVFSILESEWKASKKSLEFKIKQLRKRD